MSDKERWVPVESISSADKPQHLYTDENGFSLCDDDGTYLMEFRYSPEQKYSLCRRQPAQPLDSVAAINDVRDARLAESSGAVFGE